MLYLTIEAFLVSTIMYLYLHKKTRINFKFLYVDNLIVVGFSTLTAWLFTMFIPETYYIIIYILMVGFVCGYGFALTMIRFWRTPNRKVKASPDEIISPADGNIIYVHKLDKGEVPVSYKKDIAATLNEVTQTDIIDVPCWIIGINMTPFDVHKNCAPVDGEIVLNMYIPGEFLSLKANDAIARNERQTIVIRNDKMTIGIVQTASRLVRRIDSYIKVGEKVKRGQWYGMIRFGSQVDVILPQDVTPNVEVGQQVYAILSVIAR